MHVIIVKPRSLKQNVKPIFNTSTNFFHSFYIFIFEKQIFSVFDAKNKMVLDLENFMRRSDEFAHSKATLHKFIALSPQQADGVLTMNKKQLDTWRSNFKGIQYKDKPSGILLRGAIDNMIRKGEKLVVLDYKTRGYPLKEDTHEHYQNQMDIYNFLLRKNGY